ncbi:MAG: hypothetical protein VB097_09525 [Rikenellaceae bacterium]|nr:hypothetical protein [Rikenellaceae bacterium]
MKRLFTLLAILLLAFTSGQSESKVFSLLQSGSIDPLLQGKIKSVKKYEYIGREVSEEIVKGELKSSSAKVYDINGNLIEAYHNGALIQFQRFDVNNNVIEQIIHNEIGVLMVKGVYKYDQNNNLVERYFYDDTPDKLNSLFIRRYDSKNRMVEYEFVRDRDSVNGKTAYLFDEKADTLMENPFYPAAGVLLNYTVFAYNDKALVAEKSNYGIYSVDEWPHKLRNRELYEYDLNDNLVYTALYDFNGIPKAEVRMKYDSTNKIVEYATFNPTYSEFTKKIVYLYNANEQVTNTIHYDAEGVKTNEISHFYNPDGELVESNHYQLWGAVYENSRTKFDKGRMIEKIVFHMSDGYRKTEYKYFDNGLFSEAITTNSYNDTQSVLISEYKLDDHDNVILAKYITKENGVVTEIRITETEIVYY